MTDLPHIIAEWRENGAPGPWVTPFDFMDHGWSLDTEGENSCVGIGHNGAPLIVHCVEQAFGLDELQLADASLIASAPAMADRIEALEAENARLREALHPFADAADEADEWGHDDWNQAAVYVGWCRAARAELNKEPPQGARKEGR